MRPLANAGGLKKTRVRQGGALTIDTAHDILAQKEVNEQVAQDIREN